MVPGGYVTVDRRHVPVPHQACPLLYMHLIKYFKKKSSLKRSLSHTRVHKTLQSLQQMQFANIVC